MFLVIVRLWNNVSVATVVGYVSEQSFSYPQQMSYKMLKLAYRCEAVTRQRITFFWPDLLR